MLSNVCSLSGLEWFLQVRRKQVTINFDKVIMGFFYLHINLVMSLSGQFCIANSWQAFCRSSVLQNLLLDISDYFICYSNVNINTAYDICRYNMRFKKYITHAPRPYVFSNEMMAVVYFLVDKKVFYNKFSCSWSIFPHKKEHTNQMKPKSLQIYQYILH